MPRLSPYTSACSSRAKCGRDRGCLRCMNHRFRISSGKACASEKVAMPSPADLRLHRVCPMRDDDDSCMCTSGGGRDFLRSHRAPPKFLLSLTRKRFTNVYHQPETHMPKECSSDAKDDHPPAKSAAASCQAPMPSLHLTNIGNNDDKALIPQHPHGTTVPRHL